MAIKNSFGWDGYLVRFVFAIVVVFATYNPEGVSYYHWVYEELPAFTVLKAFIGVVLLIGWIILIRATLGSIGFLGVLLAAGVSWSHIRRRISGQLDTDELNRGG